MERQFEEDFAEIEKLEPVQVVGKVEDFCLSEQVQEVLAEMKEIKKELQAIKDEMEVVVSEVGISELRASSRN